MQGVYSKLKFLYNLNLFLSDGVLQTPSAEDETDRWTTSRIVDVLHKKKVKTKKSEYTLLGNMDLTLAREYDLPDFIVKGFKVRE